MTRRVAELDALRAFAAAVVLLFHLNPPAFVPGWTGVDLFFVLSGYLITTIILDHLDARRFVAVFYARRGLRIWPIYYLALAAVVLAAPLVPEPKRPPLGGLGYYLTFTQNLPLWRFKLMPRFHDGFDHTWTLALEEQFYIIWPALIALAVWSGWDRLWDAALRAGAPAVRLGIRLGQARRMVRWRRDVRWLLAPGGRTLRLLGLCLGLIALAWMARAGGYIRMARYSERILLARCDGFALGGLMAVILNDRRRVARRINRYRLAFGLVMAWTLVDLTRNCLRSGTLHYLGLPTPADPAGTILKVNVFYLGLVGLVVTSAGTRWLAPLRWRPLCYLGLISYGIYLYHYPIYWYLGGYDHPYETSFWRGAFKMGVTVAVAVASWHLIERPILSLKDRFKYDAREEGAPVKPVVPAGSEPEVAATA